MKPPSMEKGIPGLQNRLLPFLALVFSFVFLYPSLENGWVNWDDEAYVLRNPMVQELNARNFAAIWTTPEQVGLYHPLTMLSLAVDEHFWGKDARGFHLTNLVLHLLNVLLVYFLVLRLGRKPILAFVVALLFGMHPMHVESVAWISARKDVLYTAFYLLCLLAWLRFREGGKGRVFWLLGSLFLFAAALLSKAAALTLPLVLLLVDYLQARRWSRDLWLEKLPFFLMSGLAWWVAQAGQQSSDSMMQVHDYPLHKTIFIGSRNVLQYLADAVFPWKMSPFHPFPFLGKIEIPAWYYLSAVPLLGGLAALAIYGRRQRWLVFGLAFFLLSIAPFLQILPYGKAISAERYTYVSYIGLFWLVGWGIERVWGAKEGIWKRLRLPVLVLAGLWVLALGIRAHGRTKIWNNGETLWTAAIQAYPDHYFAYLSRGKFRVNEVPQLAKEDISRAIALNPGLGESHYELARIHEAEGDFEKAFTAYQEALARDSSLSRAWLNLGLIKARQKGDLAGALKDFDQAIARQPDYALGYLNRALAKKGLGDMAGAVADFGEAIRLEPWNAVFYRYRGSHFLGQNEIRPALADFESAAEIEPKNGENYFLMARAAAQAGDIQAALQNAEKARGLGFKLPAGFLEAVSTDSSAN